MHLRCRGASQRPVHVKQPLMRSSSARRGSASIRGPAGHRATAFLLETRAASRRPASRSRSGNRNPKRWRRYFNAHAATPYLCFRSRDRRDRCRIRPGSFQPRRPQVRTPEAGPLACRRVRPVPSSAIRPPAPQAPHPSSREQTVCSSRPHGRGMGCSVSEVWTAGITFHASPLWGGPASHLRRRGGGFLAQAAKR
jgi:hypothetical protein